MQKQIIHALLTYKNGEFQAVKLYSTQEKALRAAAKHVYVSFDANFVDAVSTEETRADTEESVDNLEELYERGAYREFVECWDEWVAEAKYEGPSPANFDIEELAVDGEG